jgi:hypothetical protein
MDMPQWYVTDMHCFTFKYTAMYVPSKQRLLSLAVCSMLFLTGFREAGSSFQPTKTSHSFSFEYKGLFYFKLSIMPGTGDGGLLLDIGTNANS